jgi:hypothetical protein
MVQSSRTVILERIALMKVVFSQILAAKIGGFSYIGKLV